MDVFTQLWKAFADLPMVEAIALGGSRSTQVYDETSDYDLYIYCSSVPDEEMRKEILAKTCQYTEIGNHYWELEDDCTLKNGVDIDILYRNISDFTADLADVVEDGHARCGYTTCFWHNLLTCKVLYDPHKKLEKLKQRFDIPYPQTLKQAIIKQNMDLLTGKLPSYDKQMMKASRRGDWVSVNHRIAAYLASYFDVIFAVNELTHPGEKRMVSYAKEHASKLPVDFEENINSLLELAMAEPISLSKCLTQLHTNLKEIL